MNDPHDRGNRPVAPSVSPLVRQAARNLHQLELLTENPVWTDWVCRRHFWRTRRTMALTPDEATAWLPALAFAVSREKDPDVLAELARRPLPEPLPPEALPWRAALIRSWERQLLALAQIAPPGTFLLATWAGRLSEQNDRCRLTAQTDGRYSQKSLAEYPGLAGCLPELLPEDGHPGCRPDGVAASLGNGYPDGNRPSGSAGHDEVAAARFTSARNRLLTRHSDERLEHRARPCPVPGTHGHPGNARPSGPVGGEPGWRPHLSPT